MKAYKLLLLLIFPFLVASCSLLEASSASSEAAVESGSSDESSLASEEAAYDFELLAYSPTAVVGDSFFLDPRLAAYEARNLTYAILEGEGLFELSESGNFTALAEGTAVIEAKSLTKVSNPITIEIVAPEENPYLNMDEDDFYEDYVPATSAEDAYFRSLEGFMSGSLEVPDEVTVKTDDPPMEGTSYVKNSTMVYEDGGATYCLLDESGEVYRRIYRPGAYIGLEEVAAYLYAFADLPANYDPDKNASPRTSMWGEYLRVNHSRFSGDTSSYPYEPELPHIDGCPGGYLTYYEVDIGTTGSGYSGLYNNGTKISRGAARIVYARYGSDGSLIHRDEDRYLFYTYNHYNDFEEYLNYHEGWGQRFGKVTAGGEEDASYGPEPTPYVDVVERPLA